MNAEFEVETEHALAEIRSALAPAAEDAARVRAAVQRALLMEAAGAERIATNTPAQTPPAFGRVGPAKWLATIACIAVLCGVVGYFARDWAPATPRPERATAARAASRPLAPAQPGSSAQAPPELAERIRDTPTARSSAPARMTTDPGDRGLLPGSDRWAARSSRRPQQQRSATEIRPGAPREPADSLDEELRVLRRVEQLLREGHPELGLSLLGQLERSVPRAQLREERFAATSMARCALESSARPALLRDFVARYPASVYLARVTRSCQAAFEAPADTRPAPRKAKRMTGAADILSQEPPPRR